MKRAQQLALAGVVGLVTILVLMLIGGFVYHFTAFWAAAALAGGQLVVVGLAAWGLKLAREHAELNETSAMPGHEEEKRSAFRMSAGDENIVTTGQGAEVEGVRTLDTQFQRLLTAIAAVVQIGLGLLAAWAAYGVYAWAQKNPGEKVPVTWSAEKAAYGIDELGLVMGLGAAGVYAVLWFMSRVTRETEGYGEAVSGNFTLGLPGMVGLGVAAVLAYFKVGFASEVAAGVIAALMLIQGLELGVNAIRSYSNIAEMENEAIDLQALPLVPMLGSVWLNGLRMLFAQSVGLARGGESTVIGRIMPRALAALVVLAIFLSCLRVVKPGTVAVLERLGSAPMDETGRPAASHVLQPGLHVTMPWPLDQLVSVPTDLLQETAVGSEIHAPKSWGDSVPFQFWMIREPTPAGEEDADEFMTGDPGSPQLLETFIQVRWKVSDPGRFYNALSHSDFYEKGATETKTRPIYDAIIQQCTQFAVTKAFATHSLEQLLITERAKAEEACRENLQAKLDSLIKGPGGEPVGCGIEIVYLTIKDLHPSYWRPDKPDPTEQPIGERQVQRGPASAFEFVVSMREWKQEQIAAAEGERVAKVNDAKGQASAAIANAQAYRSDRVARAQGEAARVMKMIGGLSETDGAFEMGLLQQQLMYRSLNGVYEPVNKIIVDPSIKDLQIFQTTEKGLMPVRPPG